MSNFSYSDLNDLKCLYHDYPNILITRAAKHIEDLERENRAMKDALEAVVLSGVFSILSNETRQKIRNVLLKD